ncbi:hypothetical protein V1274_004974 [Bradyrhizobium sp. AZCC 1614]
MSKKTRKKSSMPSPKTRKASAAKPAAAKTASKTTRRSTPASTKKRAAKVANKATKTATKKPAKTAKSASAKASHKPTSKQLIKSNLSDTPKPAAGTGLVEGAMAPPFSLPRDGGGSVSLADYAGRKLVLFFYPRADTPGCTREGDRLHAAR